MSVLKLSKNDIKKSDDGDNKIKLKKSQVSYDSAMVSGWETTNKDSLNTLNNYYTKLNNNEWLSADDISAYRKALDSYISTSNRLRGLNKSIGDGYSEEDEKNWTDSIGSMNSTYDSVSKLHSSFKTAEAYDTWYKKETFIDEYLKDADKATTEFEYDDSWIKEADRRKEEDTILNSEDFEEYSQKGLAIENPSYWDSQKGLNITNPFTGETWRPFAEDVKNVATFVRDAAKGSAGDRMDIASSEYAKYSFMNEDEVAIYSYYLGKGDKESADKYLSSIEDTLNQRLGGQLAENVQNANLEAVMAIATGLDKWASGVRNLDNFIMGTEADPTTATQYAGSIIRENIESDFWKGAWDLGVTLSNQLPSILVGTLTGNIGGLATMGVSVAGNSYAEMRNLGYDEWQSRGYAALVTAAELGLQSVIGGISSLGGKYSLTKNVLSKIDGIDNAIGRIAAKWGVSMVSEGFEESAQSVLEPIFKAIVTKGEEWDGIDWGEVAYSGLLGALSAGVLEPVGIIANDVSTTKAGEAILNVGALDRLKSVGSTFSADSVAYQLAGKVDENTGAYQIGRLLNEVNATLSEQNMTDIVEALKSNHMRPEDAKTIAKALNAVVEGAELTAKQKAALDGNEIASKVFFDVIVNKNSTFNQRMQGYTEAINMVKNGVNPKAETAQNSTVASQTEIPSVEIEKAEGTAKESEFSWSPDGKTTLIGTGEEVSVEKISSIKNGVVSVRLADGREVNAKDVSFSTEDEALMYEMVASLGVSPKTAMSMIDIFKKGNGAVSAQDFRIDAPLAYKYGMIEYVSGLGKLGLTYDQKADLFALGRKDAKAKREADIAKDKAKVESAKNAQSSEKAKDTTVSKTENVAEKKGRIFNEDGTMADIEELKSHAEKDVQKSGIEVIEFLSTVLSGDYYVYESYLNDENKRVYKDAKGNEVYAPNGFFRGADGSLHIDLNAGEKGVGYMLNTLAHEQGHYIKRVNKAGFKLLSDYILKYYEETGVDVDDLIKNRMDLMRSRGRLEGLNETQAYDKAFEDIICDGLETIYHDGKVLNMIADLKTTKQGRTVIQQLFNKIKEIINKIVNAYKGVGGVTKAGQEVAKMSLQKMKDLQKIFAQALVEADEVYQTLNGNGQLPQEGDIQFSLRVDGENIEGNGEVTKNLVALHNLSETNLLRVIELGGFPMPSIAVTTTELSHENYGDVTVVFGRETIDPESDSRNIVYDRDAWTPTTPTVDVKLSNQGVDSLVKDLQDKVGDYSSYKRSIFSFFDGKYRDNNGDYIVSEYDYTKESFGERAIKNSGIVAAYLSEKGVNVEPVYTERGFTMGWASFTRKEATELFDFVGITKDITRDNATQEQRDAILEKYIEYQAKKKLSIFRRFNKNPNLTIEDAIESIRKDYDDGDVSQLFFMAEDFFNEKRPKDVYDEYATIDKMQAAITDKQDFYNWFWGKIESAFEKKGIDNYSDVFDRRGNRRSFEQRHFAYTAANIVKAMSKGEQEGKVGFGMTAGALAAKLSKRFDSIEDIHDAKEYLVLVSEEDLKAFNDKTYELYNELVTAIAGKSSDFMSDSHRRDDVGDILGKCAAAKPLTIENIKRIFDRETKGYNLGYKFNNDIAEQALLLFESLKHIPTTYFEAKPRRVVGFNEIKTVLIPETASQKLKNQLEKSHIKYQVYDNAKETRREIIQDLEDVKFSDRDSDGNELSKEQQEFFKDSKVRDEDGNLQVVYNGVKDEYNGEPIDHGFTYKFLSESLMNKDKPNRFGFFFTDSKKTADDYSMTWRSKLQSMQIGRVNEVYLNIKNPLDLRPLGLSSSEKDFFHFLEQNGVITYRSRYKSDYKPVWRRFDVDGESLRRQIEAAGYDGVVFHDYGENEGTYVAFSSEQVKLTTNKAPTSDSDIRYSDRDFASQVDDVLSGADTTETHLKLMDTPKLLQDAGLPNLPILMTAKHLKTITSDFGEHKANYHGLSVDIVKKLPEYISDPVMITDSLTRNDSIVIITEAVDSDNRPVIAAILLNGKGAINNKYINANIMTSAYGKDNFQSFINKIADNNAVIYWNKKKSQDLSVNLGVQFSNILTSLNSDTIIRKAKAFVKQKTENSVNKFSDRDPELAAQREKVNQVLEKENAKLKEDNQYLKELVKLQRKVTHGTKFTKSSVQIVASRLMRYASAKGNRAELVNLLNEFYGYIAEGNDLTWESVAEKAQPAIDWLKNNVSRTEKLDAYSREVLKTIRSKRIYLDEQQQAEAAYVYGSFYEYRKKAVGNLTIVNKNNENGATSLDSQWQEFAERYPKLFDADMNSNEMPMKLLEIVNDLRNFKYQSNEYEYADDMVEQDLLSKVYDSYWDVSTLHTVADSMQKDITKLKIEHRKKMAEVREYHNEKHSQLKQDYQEKIARIREDYRERNAKTTRELMDRYQESRAKAIEGRHKTEVRNRLKKTIADLRTILNNGTKDRNVKIELQDSVSKALALADVLLSDEYNNEAIVRLGVESVTDKEADMLAEYNAILDILAPFRQRLEAMHKDLLELKRSNASETEIDALKAKMEAIRNNPEYTKASIKKSELNKALADVFIRERNRYDKQKAESIMDALVKAYESLQNSDSDFIKNAYDKNLRDRLVSIRDTFENVSVKDMSLKDLQDIYKAYTMVKHVITESNTLFRDGRKESLGKRIKAVQSGLRSMYKERKDRPALIDKVSRLLGSFSWNNLRPVDAFERVGVKELTDLYWDAVSAQDTYSRDVVEAGEVIAKARAKYGYKKWDLKTAKTFKTSNGLDFKLTLGDIMSIYAYSFREQAYEHMTIGGFTFDTGKTYKEKKGGLTYVHRKLTDTYIVGESVIQEIINSLEAEQRAYVEEIQRYLTELGAKGNEVARILYGIDIFTEEHYFPLQSEKDYRSSVEQALNNTQTMVSLKNTGMTKATVPHAKNPIVLRAFDDVVLEHIDKMSKYHAYVIPIENLQKVFNNSNQEDVERSPIATQALISSIFGEEATDYLNQYITDLNGGGSVSGAKNPLATFFGKAKGVSVAANLSVVAQQYFAVIRAMAEVDAKHFIPFLNGKASKSEGSSYEELKKYAPVAVIKEMGGFDVGSNRGAKDYIGLEEAPLDGQKIWKKFQDVTMAGASLMDKFGWVTIWKAVKKEVASTRNDLRVGSDEFLKACGKRFTEVVTKTQVYDSVNTRSGYMRSKHDSVKYLTSFMGEPTASVGMYFTAINNFYRSVKSKNKSEVKRTGAKMARTLVSLPVAGILTAIARSAVQAMRDDDDEEAFVEKWIEKYTSNFKDDLNPLTYLPIGRDIMSIINGWDVERPDMTLIADLITSGKRIVDGIFDEGVTGEEILDTVEALLNMFGIPLKNVIRDARGFITTIKLSADGENTTDAGIDIAIREGWTGEEISNKQQLYEAYLNNDKEQIKRVEGRFEDKSEIEAAIRKALRENDSRIREAAQAVIDGNHKERIRLTKEIIAEGHFKQDLVVAAINAELNYLRQKIKEEEAKKKKNG